jgi:hypothetical protein
MILDGPAANKLMDIEMKDAPKVKAEDFYGDKYNMGLLKELMKTKAETKDQPKEKEDAMRREMELIQERNN